MGAIGLEFGSSVGESKRSRLCVQPPCDEPITCGFDLFDCFTGAKLELDSANNFDFAVVTGDRKRSQDDMVKVDHGADDDVGPFGVGELRCTRCCEDQRLREFKVFCVDSEEIKGSLEVVGQPCS